MVLALDKDFFKDWKWQDGDHYLRINPDETLFDSYIKNISCWDATYDPEEFLVEVIPLPSQKQLQDICMNLIQCSPQDLLRFFEAWLYEDEIRPVVSFNDFDDLWLKYTMWVYARQSWNGEAWI